MSHSFKAPFHIRFTFHLRVWHRRLGISASAFILFLSVSGLLLNHSDDFKLTQSHVSQSWLLSLYGIKPPTSLMAYQLPDKNIIAVDDQLWLDQKWIQSDVSRLRSAVVFNTVIVVALEHELILLDLEGELIDRIHESMGIPAEISKLYADPDKLWVKTNQGIFTTDEQLLEWQMLESATEPDWVKPAHLTSTQIEDFSLQYRARLLTWERVLLDIHSGRIWGKLGPLFSDLIALLLILLSCSGLYMWLRRSRA